jgi:hypothetical protein
METPQEHKSALRRLNAISKLLDLNKFYSINITRWGNVTLQGNFDNEVIKWAIKNRFTVKVNDEMGYISFTRGKFDITLL